MILSIPALNLNRYIVKTPIHSGKWQIDGLTYNVGHLAGTSPFGSIGNAVVIGHVTLPDNREGPFINLANLKPDDKIIIQTPEGHFVYIVEKMKLVDPDDLSVVAPTEDATLTLLTCTDWDVALQRYLQRLILTAHLIETQ